MESSNTPRSEPTAHSRAWTASALAALLALTSSTPSHAQATWRTSVDSLGSPVSSVGRTAITPDGRYVVFGSSSAFVAGDTNGVSDVFVHDRVTGTTVCISVTPAGTPGDSWSWSDGDSISDDGRYVVFASQAGNLTPDSSPNQSDVFVRDLVTHQTRRVSVDSAGLPVAGWSARPVISGDGRYVAFDSTAIALVPGDTPAYDVYVKDLVTGSIVKASVDSAGIAGDSNSNSPSISADGRFVAFDSDATNLVAGDTNGQPDVFVRDLVLGTTLRASVTSAGAQGDQSSLLPSICDDGRYVAFQSWSTNLVPGDTNGAVDVFLHDFLSGVTQRVSLTNDEQQGNGPSLNASISATGEAIVFESSAPLAAPDTDSFRDVFLRHVPSGRTWCISVASNGTAAGGSSTAPCITGDGHFVAFIGDGTNLVGGPAGSGSGAYVREQGTCTPTVATYCSAGTTSHGCLAAMSASGIPSASATSGFTLRADPLPGGVTATMLYGVGGADSAPFGDGSSTLCIRQPLQRTGMSPSGGTPGACDGALVLDWNRFRALHPAVLGAPFAGGATIWAQAWFRDPSARGGMATSNALWFTLCP